MLVPVPKYRFWLVFLAIAFLPAATGFNDYHVSVMAGALLVGLLGQSWSLMARCGLISLGHAAFFGLGAYGAGVASQFGIPIPAAIAVGGVSALLFSPVFMGLAWRMKGAYFALATLVIAAIPKGLALGLGSLTGGARGMMGLPSLSSYQELLFGGRFSSERLYEYYFLLTIALTLGALDWWFVNRSRFGMAAAALKQDEEASRALGISPMPYRMLAIATSSLFAGVAGGFFSFQVGYLEPNYLFSLHFSVIPMVVAIFGGLLTSWGPLLGALLLGLLDEFVFRRVFLSSHEILYGLTLMVSILLFPQGIFKAVMQKIGRDRIAYR